MSRVRHRGKGDGHEGESVYGRADHRDFARVTSCSMKRCSPRSPMRGTCSPSFKMTTTRSGHTAGSAICRRLSAPDSALLTCSGPGRLSYLGAPRPVPLHHRATRAQMTPGLHSSPDERRGTGQPGLNRIDIEPIRFRPEYVVDYAFKAF